MSKSRRNRNKQSTSPTPSTEKLSKGLTLPPPGDPSWDGFAEQHQRFLERHPHHEERMSEEFDARFKPDTD